MQVFAALCERTRGPIVYCVDDKNAMLLVRTHSRPLATGALNSRLIARFDVRLQNFSSKFSARCLAGSCSAKSLSMFPALKM